MGPVRRPQPARARRAAADRQLCARAARSAEQACRAHARGVAEAEPRGHRDPARRHAASGRLRATPRSPGRLQGADHRHPASRVAEAVLRALGARPAHSRPRAERNGLDGVVGRTVRDRQRGFRCRWLAAHDQRRPLATATGALRPCRLERPAERDELEILRTAAANSFSTTPTALALRVGSQRQHLSPGRDTFVAATAAELAALRLAVDPVLRDLERDPETRAAIEEIQSLKAQLGQSPAGLPACYADW